LDEVERTEDVEVLLGDPKKAVIAMAVPAIVALLAQSINSVIDAVWVAGLGSDALAAVTIVIPLFFIILGISNGIGIGSAAVIAKRIGANDRDAANNAATHAFMIASLLSIALTLIFILNLEPIIRLIASSASESVIQNAIDYAWPMTVGLFIFVFVGVVSSILRAEGAAKRAMTVLIVGAAANMVLDPIMIYDIGLGWGMMGAGLATCVAEGISLSIMLYWYFIRKSLYVRFVFKRFRFRMAVLKDILKVGIPASVEFQITSLVIIVTNSILLTAGGDDAVSIYGSVWRLISVIAIPCMGIASGMIPICAAAYGAGRPEKISFVYNYCMKVSFASMAVIAILAAIFAPYLIGMFTYSEGAHHLEAGMIEFMRIATLFLPTMGLAIVGASFFQAMGMGMKSLISMVFSNFLFLPAIYLISIHTSELIAIWFGVSCFEIIGAGITTIWSYVVMRKIVSGRMGDLKLDVQY